MKCLKIGDTIKMGVYSGMTVGECVKKYGKKVLLEVLKYYDLDDELSRKYYHKKDDQKVEVQTLENYDEYPYPWEGANRNYQEFFGSYDEMQSSQFDYPEESINYYDGVDDEYWYSLYLEGMNKKENKICDHGGSFDPPYNEDRPLWRPRSSYKPWIYGK